jgi:hypothetical protein
MKTLELALVYVGRHGLYSNGITSTDTFEYEIIVSFLIASVLIISNVFYF